MGPAPDFNADEWFNVKFTLGLDLPNLPYFIDGDINLTEHVPILRQICRKY
jgi:glutathione S-transferase